MKQFSIMLLLLLSSGCTTTMYIASTGVVADEKNCTLQTYWYTTDYLIGSKSDESISVRMGERRPVTYKKESIGFVYLGEKGGDIMMIGDQTDSQRFVCGELQGVPSLEQFEGDVLYITMYCKAKLSPFSKTKGYLPYREEPYVLKVTQEKQFRLIGGLPDAPLPPICTPE